MASQLSRRQLLRSGAGALGAAAGLTLLAACGSGASATLTTSAGSAVTTTGVATTATVTAGNAAASAPAGKGGTLTLMIQTDAKQQTMYEKITQPFTQQNAGVKLNIIQGGAGATDIQQKLLLLISANTAPDVYWTHTYINGGLASLGIPEDIAPYLAKDKPFDVSDIFPSSMKDFAVQGKQYAFPRETTALILAYNKDLFGKAGVDLPKAGWTWDNYVQACQKLTSGTGPTKIWGTAGWPNSPYIYPAIIRAWQLGGDIVNADRTQYTLDQAPGVQGFQDIVDLIQKYKVHASAGDLQGTNVGNLFTTGRIAMIPTINVYSAFANAKFTWDIADLPYSGTKTTRVASAGHSMTTASPLKDLSWGLLSLLASKQAFQDYFDMDALPVASKSVRDAAVKANGSKPPAHIQLGIDALSYARPEPVIGNWIGVHQTIASALDGAYGPQNKSVKDALTSVAAQVNQLIKAKPTATK